VYSPLLVASRAKPFITAVQQFLSIELLLETVLDDLRSLFDIVLDLHFDIADLCEFVELVQDYVVNFSLLGALLPGEEAIEILDVHPQLAFLKQL
jgi:hypothetical protein